MSVKKNYEILPALYMCVFQLIRPIVMIMPQYSTAILFGVAAVMCCIAFFRVVNEKRRIVVFTLFCMGFVLYFLMEMFRYNKLLSEAMYYFVIYGIIPVYLLIGVRDYAKLLKYYCIFSLCRGVLYLLDPLNGYQWSVDYMGFGFSAMLPAVAASVIVLFYYKKKLAILPLTIFLVELFICANKGAILTAILLVVVSYVYFGGVNKIHWGRLAVIVLSAGVVISLRMEILGWLFSVANYFNLNSYSLATFQQMLTGSTDSIFSIRTNLWEYAMDGFKQNPLLGMGEGWFEGRYHRYPHNILMEILVNTGLVGIGLFVVALIVSIRYVVREKNSDLKVFLIGIFILWFVPCMMSLTFWSVMEFWVYFGLCMYRYSLTHASLKKERIG